MKYISLKINKITKLTFSIKFLQYETKKRAYTKQLIHCFKEISIKKLNFILEILLGSVCLSRISRMNGEIAKLPETYIITLTKAFGLIFFISHQKKHFSRIIFTYARINKRFLKG